SIRTVDTVARMNGDDFAILIEEFTSSQQVMNIAERVQKTAKHPISINGIEAHISASIGIVVKTKLYKSPENIIRDAEIALYRSKEMGRGLIKVFDKKMLKLAVESMQIENDLRIGIQNQDFFLYYQPIIHVESQRLAGLEALIRWNHPVQGIISPVKFIPIAEETGLINPIGKWVISEACRQLKEWKRTLSGSDNLTLNVNISGKQLSQKDLANFVSGVLRENCLDPRYLKFELTESVLMNDSKTAIKILNDLKDIGINLVIDDFGTGYSSLSYLKQFPLDDLKIGRFFIRGLGVDEECIEIVKTIVALAKNLELNVVAEGVDREEQLFVLKDLYCDMVQGHLFSKPVDKNSATKLINNFI
ncbi:MAG: bifunctional diguanylate cyclase/phosphodiesterase, partial [bacterium]